jgi:hypothetical protein
MATVHAVPIPVTVVHQPAWQAWRLLHVGFVLAPLLAGLDKFAHVLTDWTRYLAPVVPRVTHIQADTFMQLVGVVEVIAALLVWWKPKVGAYVVAAWLCGIIVDLLLAGGFLDIALRDFGLLVGALALGRLSAQFDGR